MNPDEQECPFCGERIKLAAQKCRHCDEWLGEHSRQDGVLGWEGDDVMVAPEGEVDVAGCTMCGKQGATPILKQFSYAPPIFEFLPGVRSMALQKEAGIRLPLCGTCRGKWRFGDAVYFLFAVGGFFGCAAAGAYVGSAFDPAGGGVRGLYGGLLGLVAWLLLLLLLIRFFKRRLQIHCVRIDDSGMLLRFPDPEPLRHLLGGDTLKLLHRDPAPPPAPEP